MRLFSKNVKLRRLVFMLATVVLMLSAMTLAGCSNEVPSKTGSSKESEASGDSTPKKGESGTEETDHSDGPPETRQGAHDFSDEQANEALLHSLGAFLELEKITTSVDALKLILDKNALDQYSQAIRSDLDKGRYKVRDFQDIKLSYYNYTVGIVGISIDYIDNSYYAVLKTNKPLTEKTLEIRSMVIASEKINGDWKIVAFFEPARKPSADKTGGVTSTTVPDAVKQIEKDLGYQ